MQAHTFHIPVMGIGYTIDTPLRVAQYGIDSAISLVDDMLIEKMREFYCKKFDLPFKAITNKEDDSRAKRITAYLNLVDKLIKEKYDEMKNSILERSSEIRKYIDMLPDSTKLKEEFNQFIKNANINEAKEWFRKNFSLGSIDVNIMTKVDSANYSKNEKLPVEYNDAHAALRGMAQSNLSSAVILSAGINPALYTYIENFDDFYPDSNNYLKKRIILKVSDFRSATIQGKFLAKKGLWVSEYRIESGLNCGGHAFAATGNLMGPILEEFKTKRDELISSTFAIYTDALRKKERYTPEQPLETKITAQGGVGTAEEHDFLLKHYELDSVGWGSPFLLVPEATIVDNDTLDLLRNAKEDDLYLSGISPLGVPFNSVKNNTKDLEKKEQIKKGTPGFFCSKQFLKTNTEFSDKPLCTASKEYQKKKITEIEGLNLDSETEKKEITKVTEKTCLCVGLGTSALIANEIPLTFETNGVSICPGPNMAYFSEIVGLKDMVDHIYGKMNIIKQTDRPNVFIKELKIYIDYLKSRLEETKKTTSEKQKNNLSEFRTQIQDGIDYYKNLFSNCRSHFQNTKQSLLKELTTYQNKLEQL